MKAKTARDVIETTPIGDWAWFGECDPSNRAVGYVGGSFSVSIFQVVAKARGKGKKRDLAIWRVYGANGQVEIVHSQAQAICDRLNQERPASRGEAIGICQDQTKQFIT